MLMVPHKIWVMVIAASISNSSPSITHIEPFTSREECIADAGILTADMGKEGVKIVTSCIPKIKGER
jgi:hypothetical protein